MKRKILFVGAVLLIVIFLLMQKNNPPSEKIKVGAIFPLTGSNATYGEMAKKGIDLALKQFPPGNIQVLYEDSQFQSLSALNAYEKLKSEDVKIFLTIGSQVAATIGPKVVEDTLMNFELTAVTRKYNDGSPLTCRAALTVEPSAELLAAYIKERNLKRIALLVTNDEQGVAYEKETAKLIRSFAEVVLSEKYLASENDFRTQLTRIKATNPDVLILISPGQQAQQILTQLQQLGFKKIILSNNWTIENASLTDLSLAEGVIFTSYRYDESFSGTDTETAAKFKRDFIEHYQQNPPIVAATAYDAITLIEQAVKEKGSLPTEISDFISGVKNFKGVSGVWTFDSNCEARQTATLKTVKNGVIIVLQ